MRRPNALLVASALGVLLALAGGAAPVATAAAAAPQVNGTAFATGWPDVDAVVSYETRQLMSNGTLRVESWQERLVRRGTQVWIERILPKGSQPTHGDASSDEHFGHKHLNAETSARWVTADQRGQLQLKLVDRHQKVVVDVPRAEFGTVAFDGRLDAAGAIVPPSIVQDLQPEGAATAAGQRWRVERSQGWTHRVLWSEPKQIALDVLSRSDDGRVRRRVTVQLSALTSVRFLPWEQLVGYESKRYDEFMD